LAIYIADDEAKKLLDTPEVVNELRIAFGEEIIENNLVDKKS
jgi:dephospho-CoA kinase